MLVVVLLLSIEYENYLIKRAPGFTLSHIHNIEAFDSDKVTKEEQFCVQPFHCFCETAREGIVPRPTRVRMYKNQSILNL